MKLYPYKAGSKSAKALAEALGIKRIKHDGPPIKAAEGETIINWGASCVDRQLAQPDIVVLNYPDAVKKASNKLTTLRHLSAAGVSCPEWDKYPEAPLKWLGEGFSVVVRHKLNGHSGEGIEILNPDEIVNVPDAPLYTKYIKKREEYRIHVFRGEAFFVQRKARKKEVPDEEVNWKVRNLAGGFIFANQAVEVPDVARNEACDAVAALELDFGAVDIILGTDGVWYVLEVNTACGLEGTTLDKYVEQFNKFR